MFEVSLRPFEASDQGAARRLILEGLGEHFGFIDESLNPDLDDVMKSYVIPGHVFIVAHIGQDLVGTGARRDASPNHASPPHSFATSSLRAPVQAPNPLFRLNWLPLYQGTWHLDQVPCQGAQ